MVDMTERRRGMRLTAKLVHSSPTPPFDLDIAPPGRFVLGPYPSERDWVPGDNRGEALTGGAGGVAIDELRLATRKVKNSRSRPLVSVAVR